MSRPDMSGYSRRLREEREEAARQAELRSWGRLGVDAARRPGTYGTFDEGLEDAWKDGGRAAAAAFLLGYRSVKPPPRKGSPLSPTLNERAESLPPKPGRT